MKLIQHSAAETQAILVPCLYCVSLVGRKGANLGGKSGKTVSD